MNKAIIKGSSALIISGFACKMLGAFFRIPLTNILGVDGIGVFQMIMVLYSFSLILSSGGMTVTLSKLVSQARAFNEELKIRSLYKIAIITSLIVGVVIGLLFFLLGGQISAFQGNNYSTLSYKILIVLLPVGGIIACLRGVIQGYENMVPTAISQIIEQAIRFVFGILFSSLLINYSKELGVFGAFLGIAIAEIFAMIYLLFFVKKLKISPEGNLHKGFYKALLPIVIGMSVFPFLSAFDSLIIVNRLKIAGFASEQAVLLYGIQTGVVGAILNLPLIISTSMASAILPSISFLKEDEKEVGERISQSIKILWITILPMVLGIMAISKPLFSLIYPNLQFEALGYAVNLTNIGGIFTIITALMQIFTTVLQARGKFFYVMGLQIGGGILKFLIVMLLCSLPEINIYGLAFSNVMFSSVVCIGCLLYLRKNVGIEFFDLAVPLFAGVVMFILVKYLVNILEFSNIFVLLIGIVSGATVYLGLSLPCLIGIFKNFIKKTKKKQA